MPGSATRTSNGVESQNCSLSGGGGEEPDYLLAPSTVMHLRVLARVRFPDPPV